MVDAALATRSPLAGLLRRGRFGASGQEPRIVVDEPAPTAMALLMARKGRAAEFLDAGKSLGIDFPAPGRWVQGRGAVVLWAGPSQWLVRRAGSYAELESEFKHLLPFGLFIDQSHARATLTVSGPGARDALAKGFEIDLHPRAFGPGQVALTQGALISAYLWQLDERPTYAIAVPRSLAGSFWHWLSEASAEYGYRIGDPGEP